MTDDIPKAWRSDHFEQFQYSARGISKPVFPKSSTSISGAGKNVRSISWSCDGRRAATGTELKGIRVWNVKSTIELGSSFPLPDSSSKPSPHNGHVGALAFSPTDPDILVSGCKSAAVGGCIVIWDLTRPRDAFKKFQISGDVLHIAFHPSGRQFAVVCPKARRDEVYFYHLIPTEGGKEEWVQREDIMLGGPGSEVGYDEINSLRFHQNGRFVMYVSNDGTIQAWEFPEVPLVDSPDSNERMEDEEALEGETSRPRTPRERTPEQEESGDVEMNDEGSKTVTKDEEETGRSESAHKGDNTEKEVQEGDQPTMEEAEPEATKFDEDKVVAISEVVEPAPLNIDEDVEMEEKPIQSVLPSRQPSPAPVPQSKAAATAQTGSTVEEAPKKKAKQLVRFKSQYCGNSVLLGFNLDPIGRFIATGGGDCRLVTYNTEDWLPFRAYSVATGTIRHVAFSADGELIAIGGDSNSDIYIVSIFSGEVVGQFKVNAMVVSLAWHPKKNWLAWATLSKANIPLWYMVKQD